MSKRLVTENHGAFSGAVTRHQILSKACPDLAPPDFFLLRRIKSKLKGKHHGSVDAAQQAMTNELNSIPVQAFLEAYENWKTRWQQCTDVEGCYL
ncbi:uncharacterized protein TNIN_13881 [Trichonephila inaurata madagascariensis]|uniref:Uncharacterized protein n=1 Tax=Trichonephila inaurata madagascariensis TaxID=2747483 RepID=A0A8X6YSP6_9ARAC|nr:uncharacterized protein TNIN_207501 [Trichonephila inaurata madagascariensis]GFY78520.1 uncharacterized protein TNIN_13881 [Trichonephila inaurata madagascariensis]